MSPSEAELEVAAEDEAGEEKPLELEIKVDEPSACERHVSVTVSRPDIDRYFDKELGEIMPEANVPGFRAGRAPKALVRSHFKSQIADKIKGAIILDSITQISESHDFSAISEPDFDFDAIELPDDGPMTFEFNLEVRPDFEMPKWQGLTLEKPVMEIGEAEINAHLEELLEDRGAVMEPVDEAAAAGDFVVINLDFKQDGKSVASAEELTVRLRPTLSLADGNIEKFDKLLSGQKSGATKSTKVIVSQEAENEELRGEELDVDIELLDVKRLVLPELTDEFVSKLGNFSNEGDLRDAIKEGLSRQLAYHQSQRVRTQITDLLTESANWDLPPELLKRQAKRELDRSVMELRSSGFSEEQIRNHVNFLRQNTQEATSKALKEHFILERIAEDQEIEASDEDYDREIMLIGMQSGESPRSVRARLEKRGMMDSLRNQIVERRVIGLIQEKAKFKEVKMPKPAATTSAADFTIAGESKADIPDAKHGEEDPLSQPVDRT